MNKLLNTLKNVLTHFWLTGGFFISHALIGRAKVKKYSFERILLWYVRLFMPIYDPARHCVGKEPGLRGWIRPGKSVWYSLDPEFVIFVYVPCVGLWAKNFFFFWGGGGGMDVRLPDERRNPKCPGKFWKVESRKCHFRAAAFQDETASLLWMLFAGKNKLFSHYKEDCPSL